MEKIGFVTSMVGRTVRIDRGGPEARTGTLLAVKHDYLVLEHEKEGLIYYNSEHIKSISVDGGEAACFTGEDKDSKFEDACFFDVLRNFKYRSVQLNRGGPEKLEGVMTSVNDDRLLLVVGDEIVTVLTYHVRNVSLLCKKKDDKDGKEDCKDDDKDKDDKKCYCKKCSDKKEKK